MAGPTYDWNNYKAIEQGETLFARRYARMQRNAAHAAAHLKDKKIEALEFGVGTGGTTPYFLDALPNMHLVCVDKDKDALGKAALSLEQHAGRIEFMNHDFAAAPRSAYRAQDGYDLIFGVFVVHNFDDKGKREVLAKTHELLKPGGTLVIGDVMTYMNPEANKRAWAADYEMLNELPQEERTWWIEHFSRFDRPLAQSSEWYFDTLVMKNSTGLGVGFWSAEITNRDDFWTVMRATKQTRLD